MTKEQKQAKTQALSSSWDRFVNGVILAFLSVGAVLGYSQYITESADWVARAAVAFVVVVCLERLLNKH